MGRAYDLAVLHRRDFDQVEAVATEVRIGHVFNFSRDAEHTRRRSEPHVWPAGPAGPGRSLVSSQRGGHSPPVEVFDDPEGITGRAALALPALKLIQRFLQARYIMGRRGLDLLFGWRRCLKLGTE